MFYHTASYENIDFLLFSPFGLSLLWSPVKIVFCELQLLSKDLTIAMFWLTFLCVSYSCLSFWLSFSLLQKYPGVFLFWLSLLSMVFVFCSCSWLVWFSEAFSVVAFCEKNTSPLHILHRVFPLLYFPRSIKTTLQKMSSLYNIVKIRLRQHCTRKLLVQCWPRAHRHRFAEK